MTTTIFNLIDSVNREGIDNSEWGLTRFYEDTFAKEFFGAGVGDKIIWAGKFLYIYKNNDDTFAFINTDNATFVLSIEGENTTIYLWDLSTGIND